VKKPFRYLDHTADLGIEVFGENLNALFTNIGKAIFETQIQGKVRARKEKSMSIKSESLEDLFIDWCRELLYDFSVSSFIPCEYTISIENLSLHAQMRGDDFDPTRHQVKLEIKNPTYHKLSVKKQDDNYCARIIFDV
jgi:SHS2 domain-containing protein